MSSSYKRCSTFGLHIYMFSSYKKRGTPYLAVKSVSRLFDINILDASTLFQGQFRSFEYHINTSSIAHLHLQLNYINRLFMHLLQDLVKSFNSWRALTDQLIMKGKDIPAFKLNAHALENSKVLKALCSLETRDVSVVLVP